jgi:hypothetical protein
MSGKKILLLLVLADFVALAVWGVSRVGFVGLFTGAIASPAGIVGTVDLVIALGLIAVWMVRDARAQGVSPVPYLVLTVALGSVGPLLYLLRRPETAPADARVRLAAQAG